MEKFAGLLSSMSGTAASRANDYYDRLSSSYTTSLLIVFATLVGISSYVGEPISCWAPVHFEGSHKKYANSYCWVRNTYYLPWEQYDIPREGEDRDYILYYQWIPFILLGQACLFYIPAVLWNGLNQKSGVDADSVIKDAIQLHKTDKVKAREDNLKFIAAQMDRVMQSSQGYVAGFHFKDCGKVPGYFCGRGLGSYLIILFLVSKVLYIANVIGQLFVLNSILSAEYNLYGFDVMGGMLESDHNWDKSASVVFPRVTMCDFRVRRLGNVHRYTVQCVLPINLYTEKIYVFLWFWMVFVAAMSVIGFITWFARMIMTGDKRSYALNHLRASAMKREFDNSKLDQFINEYLRQDGMFLLRLIGHNTNNITVTEIMGALWDRFIAHEEDKANKLDAPYNPVEDSLPLLPDKGADPLPAKAPPLEGPLAS